MRLFQSGIIGHSINLWQELNEPVILVVCDPVTLYVHGSGHYA